MKLAHNNIFIVMLMLVTFIGQAMASTAVSYSATSCVHGSMNAEMTMMSHDNVDNDTTDEVMNHSSMMLSDINKESTMDCCQEQCQCPMNGCVSLSLLFNSYFNSEIIAEQKIPQSSSLHKSQVSASLYRPPIS